MNQKYNELFSMLTSKNDLIEINIQEILNELITKAEKYDLIQEAGGYNPQEIRQRTANEIIVMLCENRMIFSDFVSYSKTVAEIKRVYSGETKNE